METIKIDEATFKEKFKRTQYLSREGKFFLYYDPKTGEEKLVKMFYHSSSSEYDRNKESIIKKLLFLRDKIDIPEISFPESIMQIKHSSEILNACVYPHYDATNLSLLLRNPSVPIIKKIDYLKRIGKILERMSQLRKQGVLCETYVNDLHEGNFLVCKDDSLKLIDVDSFHTKDTLPLCSKYLSFHSMVDKYREKYQRQTFKTYLYSHIWASENTDIYCYIIMILNLLLGVRQAHYMDTEEFSTFMMYLSDNGIPLELLEIFINIYNEKVDNVNPYELLDVLIPFLNKTGGKVL